MWKNKGHEFDEYAKIWSNKQNYVLYGAGNLGKEFLDKFKEKINIIAFSDTDRKKIGTLFCGKDVKTLDECENCKIIVSSRFYKEIKETLMMRGLKEDIDFTREQKFEAIFSFYNDKKLIFREFDISITSFCTLNCRDCNMQMCKYEKKEHFSLETIKKEVDIYFKWVDYVQYLGVLGGEPFLHPQLCEILEYIARRYRDRIGKLEVLTNGTCIPGDEYWKLSRKYRISIQLSDYSVGVPAIENKVRTFQAKLNEENIQYTVLKYDNWLDFGLKHDLGESQEELHNKFTSCNNPWRSVYQNKYYYCHLQTSAYRAGLAEIQARDVFDLSDYSIEKRIELLEFDLKKNERGYISFCEVCRGCSDVNDTFVAPAVQVMRGMY